MGTTTRPPADGGGRKPRERREKIKSRVVDEGFVRIEQLATELGVTPMTIRRDLDHLQSKGWLRKVRGGATAQPSTAFHGDVRHRTQSMAEEKEAIARTALPLITPGQSVIIDDSTTALALAPLLAQRAPLTVITNFVPAAQILAGSPGIELISLGGTYYPAYDAYLGLRTIDAAGSLHADTLFASTTAITHGHCYHQSQETVAVKRALITASHRRILLVDHTKFHHHGLYQLTPLTTFDLIITDAGIPSTDLNSLHKQGINTLLAHRKEITPGPVEPTHTRRQAGSHATLEEC
jgi:DeoR/GlpR family transcriptional regulator of sugar metabolism